MSRRWVIVSLSVAVVVLAVIGAGAVGATVYDRHASKYLLPGTVIGDVNVGDMRADLAVQTLRDKLEAPLHRELTVKAGDHQVLTTPWDLGYRVDVKAAVAEAQGHAVGPMVTRVWKRVFSHPSQYVPAKPAWHDGGVDTVLDELAAKVKTDPVDADVSAETGWMTMVPGKPGTELDRDAAREAIVTAAQLNDSIVTLPTKSVPPEVGTDAFHQVILVRTGENRLYLYRNGSIAKDWPVATGTSSFATPPGRWQIIEKIVDPVWYNPGSAWAAGMPRTIPAGPSNPLGQRALALDAPAILIHGTPDRSSIGYNASHGCIRMLAENEQELFDMVEVGTPVLITSAGVPRPRVDAPSTGDPALAAAVQF
ncbi:MAG: L,D-transpeptidase family protein [Acidimicrobiales bacterium]